MATRFWFVIAKLLLELVDTLTRGMKSQSKDDKADDRDENQTHKGATRVEAFGLGERGPHDGGIGGVVVMRRGVQGVKETTRDNSRKKTVGKKTEQHQKSPQR